MNTKSIKMGRPGEEIDPGGIDEKSDRLMAQVLKSHVALWRERSAPGLRIHLVMFYLTLVVAVSASVAVWVGVPFSWGMVPVLVFSNVGIFAAAAVQLKFHRNRVLRIVAKYSRNADLLLELALTYPDDRVRVFAAKNECFPCEGLAELVFSDLAEVRMLVVDRYRESPLAALALRTAAPGVNLLWALVEDPDPDVAAAARMILLSGLN